MEDEQEKSNSQPISNFLGVYQTKRKPRFKEEHHELAYEVANYFNETVAYWVRWLRGRDIFHLKKQFDQIRSRQIDKKDKAKIFMSEVKGKKSPGSH